MPVTIKIKITENPDRSITSHMLACDIGTIREANFAKDLIEEISAGIKRVTLAKGGEHTILHSLKRIDEFKEN